MGLSIYTSPDPEALEDVEWGDEILQRAYSGFGRWRAELADAAGIGTRAGTFGPEPDVDYDAFERRNYDGIWLEGTEPEDPLYLLFIHSDCDGTLAHKYLGDLADRLEEILPNLAVDEGYYFSTRTLTERFIAGLRKAHEAGHGLVFA